MKMVHLPWPFTKHLACLPASPKWPSSGQSQASSQQLVPRDVAEKTAVLRNSFSPYCAYLWPPVVLLPFSLSFWFLFCCCFIAEDITERTRLVAKDIFLEIKRVLQKIKAVDATFTLYKLYSHFFAREQIQLNTFARRPTECAKTYLQKDASIYIQIYHSSQRARQ